MSSICTTNPANRIYLLIVYWAPLATGRMGRISEKGIFDIIVPCRRIGGVESTERQQRGNSEEV